LAAQFYLTDMRVLKVMFTAIVTAMLLTFATSSVGLLDFGRIWVPPTYFWPGVIGGLILGVGFIVGGYCPGTSLVSMATLKVDGLLFASGVFGGLFLFAQSMPWCWTFWNTAGSAGRLTLADWLGVDAGLLVIGVLLMAVAAFWFAERVERFMRRVDVDTPTPPNPRIRRFRRVALAAGVVLALATAIVGQPGIERRIAWQQDQLSRRLEQRDAFVDPAELLDLMHNNQIQRVLLDVRDPSDYNLFHLLDARRSTLDELDAGQPSNLSQESVVVVMSNDEQRAIEAWKRLAVQGVNAYVLAGGVNRWLDLYREHLANIPGPQVAATGDDLLRYEFDTALGARTAYARPSADEVSKRSFARNVKLRKPVRAQSGGCG
ncbi:MAG: YeeE/YedE family protein, partial [Planctomycetes bacterium]|nr:YeeE/YedE family protein [Planctomycetota bacterium]